MIEALRSSLLNDKLASRYSSTLADAPMMTLAISFEDESNSFLMLSRRSSWDLAYLMSASDCSNEILLMLLMLWIILSFPERASSIMLKSNAEEIVAFKLLIASGIPFTWLTTIPMMLLISSRTLCFSMSSFLTSWPKCLFATLSAFTSRKNDSSLKQSIATVSLALALAAGIPSPAIKNVRNFSWTNAYAENATPAA